jgi:hypothetical protein
LFRPEEGGNGEDPDRDDGCDKHEDEHEHAEDEYDEGRRED